MGGTHFGFYSTLDRAWGGSEELWSQSVEVLLRRGNRVSVSVSSDSERSLQVLRLKDAGAYIHSASRRRIDRRVRHLLTFRSAERSWLRQTKPDVVVISMSWHLDDISIALACQDLGIPYVLLVQAASPFQWIRTKAYQSTRSAFAKAAACYFVSAQNREVLESNLALDLSSSSIVDNAFTVKPGTELEWPSEDVWRLACVGRINFQSKGQDLLINVLRQPKWRSRCLRVSLLGQDEGNLQQVRDLSALYGLSDVVTFLGFSEDITSIWAKNHALLLPSRYEGNSLAMLEAMVCGRVPIVTDVGRTRELIDDNAFGFIASAPTTEMVDDAMERAWNARHDWQTMGKMAASAIRARHSMQPAEDFADLILDASGIRRRGDAQHALSTPAFA
ncbi:MAG: glycosyltransferase family 4 protein [Hyphomicrobiales bacterium]|nr:glycosyltransferase family 4 protein [Hyphomicrobiales bacterium]